MILVGKLNKNNNVIIFNILIISILKLKNMIINIVINVIKRINFLKVSSFIDKPRFCFDFNIYYYVFRI